MLVAGTGQRCAVAGAQVPPTAITLDMFLPDMLGWTVLNQLKRNPETRHIPVQILTIEEERQYGLERGAFSFITKTVTTDSLEEAFDRMKSFTDRAPAAVARGRGRPGRAAEHPRAAGSQRRGDHHRRDRRRGARDAAGASFDCVVLDLRLPDMTGFELLAECRRSRSCAKRLSWCSPGGSYRERGSELRKKAKSIVLKGVRSPERLLDETALFLHRVIADLPAAQAEDDREAARKR